MYYCVYDIHKKKIHLLIFKIEKESLKEEERRKARENLIHSFIIIYHHRLFDRTIINDLAEKIQHNKQTNKQQKHATSIIHIYTSSIHTWPIHIIYTSLLIKTSALFEISGFVPTFLLPNQIVRRDESSELVWMVCFMWLIILY